MEYRMAKRHAAPCSNRDYDFFYDGLEDKKLLIQCCSDCGTLRNPPSPMCAQCRSLRWVGSEMSGAGTLHSYTVHYHPPMPGFDLPHPVGVVSLDEGIRFLGGLDAIRLDALAIGIRVQAEFFRRGAVASLRFRQA
jgi:uncharacterized protein